MRGKLPLHKDAFRDTGRACHRRRRICASPPRPLNRLRVSRDEITRRRCCVCRYRRDLAIPLFGNVAPITTVCISVTCCYQPRRNTRNYRELFHSFLLNNREKPHLVYDSLDFIFFNTMKKIFFIFFRLHYRRNTK